MPARTNDFQMLTVLIHRALADRKTKITESAMVPTSGLPYEREVDVLIETDAAPYRVKIAIEAKNHSRKLDIGDIDEIVAKYRGPGSIQVNKVIVISRNGYTPHAHDKASLSAIDLVVLSEIERANWNQLLLPLRSPVQGFQVGPYPRDVQISPIPEGLELQEIVSKAVLACECSQCGGRSLGTPWTFAVNHCNQMAAQNAVFNQHLGFLKGRGGGAFDTTVEMKPANWMATCGHNRWGVEVLKYIAHTRWGTGEMKVKAYTMTGETVEPKVIQHGTFTAAGYKFDIVMADGMDLSKSTIHLSEAT